MMQLLFMVVTVNVATRSRVLYSKHAKLFETGKGETTATVFWVFDIFFFKH